MPWPRDQAPLRRTASTAPSLRPRPGPRLREHAALRRTAWVALVLAIAAFGAVVVRNVTDVMVDVVQQRPVLADDTKPSR